MDGQRLSGTRLLVVDDDEAILRLHQTVLEHLGAEVTCTYSAEEALALLEQQRYDLILTDVRLPGMSGTDLLVQVRRDHPHTPVILATGYATIEAAVEAMRLGATDYATKPLNLSELEARVTRAIRVKRLEDENSWLHDELRQAYGSGIIVAISPRMREISTLVDRVSASDATVLVTGESGTGKELVARAIHFRGPRSAGPFIAVNCAAIPPALIESELFGHARGAFTGAVADTPGKLELAQGGTLFLDEIGDLPLEMQPKLLRAIELKTVERLGQHRPRRIDFRLVAATNQDLQLALREGRLREDLYYRLSVVPIHIPPLRERREDIPPLVRFLVRRLAGDEAPAISEPALAELARRSWRGNVRELSNTIERVLALHDEGPIRAEELPAEDLGRAPLRARPAAMAGDGGRESTVLLPADGASLDDMVRDLVTQALERKSWNQSAAARLLRIPRHVLQYRMEKFRIVRPDDGPPGGAE